MMKHTVYLFIIFNFILNTLAFNANMPLKYSNNLRTYNNYNICMNSDNNNFNRRNILKTFSTFITLGSINTISNYIDSNNAIANAETKKSVKYDDDIDIDVYRGEWTEHKGSYSENELDDYKKTPSGLLYKDIEVGYGPTPADGDAVTIQMVGYIFETGEKWCNTYKGIPSFQSVVRAGVRENQKYMKGLNEGVASMQKGGKRILVIPAYLAYSYTTIFSDKNPNVPIIPGGSNLVCYIEVEDFRKLN